MTEKERCFYSDADLFFDEWMHDSPTLATFLGDHRFDDRFGDFSREAKDSQRRRMGKWLIAFNAYDTTGWSTDAHIDRIIMIQLCKNFIRDHDVVRRFERDPSGAQEVFWGIDSLITRDFAPLPERLASVLGRLKQVERVLRESAALIDVAEVPGAWAEVALESSRHGMSLFTQQIPELAQAAPEIETALLTASETAAIALKAHCAWLEQDVMPWAQGNFAVGKELFNEILAEDHLVDYNADELLTTGWKLFNETAAEMAVLAASLDPHKTVAQLLEENKSVHPAADALLEGYRTAMASARHFVLENRLATIPEGERICVQATPVYERATTPFAAYNMPGFFEKVQEGIFYVTPANESADPPAIERKLRGHPWSKITTTAVHEAYPGHHLQLAIANTLSSTPRKLASFLSFLFIEGWAFYCEELMEKLGFTNQPIQKLSRLHAQLWRASRIIIDVSLHNGTMTVDAAIRFLIERAALEPNDAKAEVLRYTRTPTQPQSYLMGKIEICAIIEEFQRRFPGAGMQRMHDAILQCGSLPPRLMRMRLFGTERVNGAVTRAASGD
jgi:uncharacterized protein (DUF885 family)